MNFAMLQLLRAIGMPGGLPRHPELALDAPSATEALERSLSSPTALRRYLVPLDLAEDLPCLSFGPVRIGLFEKAELGSLFDIDRLRRLYPDRPVDLDRLAQFHWLVVEETVLLDPMPEKRSVPILFADLRADLGAFDPHQTRFSEAVERALFFLLLAPWEERTTMLEVDWRCFKTPWVYAVDFDLVASQPPPPDPDTLSWIEDTHLTRSGEEVWYQRPLDYPTKGEPGDALHGFDESAWNRVNQALRLPLFDAPVVHFFVRAFLSDRIDELLAHMTTIEAAVGSESDHRRSLRRKPDPHSKLTATDCVVARIAALLDDGSAVSDYRNLFQVRSEFVHGRRNIGMISTGQRAAARVLARRVAAALVDRASDLPHDRDEALLALLAQGSAMVDFGPDKRHR